MYLIRYIAQAVVALGIFCLAGIYLAHADILFKQTTETENAGEQVSSYEQTISIQKHLMKIEIKPKNADHTDTQTLIFNAQTGRLWIFSDKEKQYVEKILPKNKTTKNQYMFEKTNRQNTFAKFLAVQYIVKQNNDMIGEVWLAKNQDTPMLKNHLVHLTQVFQSDPQQVILNDLLMLDLGYPVYSILKIKPDPKNTQSVVLRTRLEHIETPLKPFDRTWFSVPDGYQKTKDLP